MKFLFKALRSFAHNSQIINRAQRILGDPGASRDDAIFSGERYFQAKVYFKGGRAPGHLFLSNQFQRCSDSVPLIGQKIFFSGQSPRRSSRGFLSLSYKK